MVKIVSPMDWVTGSPVYYMLGMGNAAFDVLNAASGYAYNALNNWALRAIDADTLRFEVRPGDELRWGADVGTHKERSEISAADHVALGENFHTGYDFMLEPGSTNTAKWLLVGQLIQLPPDPSVAASPPVAIEMVGEKMSAVVRYQNAAGQTVEQRLWLDSSDIVRGQEYHLDIYANVSNDSSGRVLIVRDGQVVVDYSGPVGYDFGGELAWKEGIYRDASPETIAAQFSNLQVSHGDMVQIPQKGQAYVAPAAAPTLHYAASGTDGAGADTVLTGAATAGSLVHLYDGTKLVSTVQANAQGAFSFSIDTLAGSHFYTATSEVGGILSSVSSDISIQVGTAADILARMDYLAGQTRIGAIVLTDTRTLTVSAAQLDVLLTSAKDALEKIVGGVNFLQLSGTSDNRISTFKDIDGNVTLKVTDTYNADVLIRQTKEYPGAQGDEVQKEVASYNITGQSYTSQYQAFDSAGRMVDSARYDAGGTMTFRSHLLDNGDSTTEQFNAAGVLQSYTIKHETGPVSMEYFAANVVGQSYVATWTAVNAAGKTVYATRTYADGSLQYDSKVNADGSTIAHSYATDGSLTQLTVTSTDGRTVNQLYTNGALVSTSTTFADKSVETDSWANGELVGQVITHVSGTVTKELYTNGVSGQTYARTYKAYSGSTLVTEERYHTDNSLDYARYTLTNGGTQILRYSSNGTLTSNTVTGQDGSIDAKTYTNGLLTRETITYSSPVNGAAKQVYDFNVVGQATSIRLSSYDASGKLTATNYVTAATTPSFAVSPPVNSSEGIPAHAQSVLSPAVDKGFFTGMTDTLNILNNLPTAQGVDITPVKQSDLLLSASPVHTGGGVPPGQIDHVDAPSLTVAVPSLSNGETVTVASGTAPRGTTVELHSGDAIVGTASVDGNGAYSISLALGAGLHQLTAVAVASSGATSAPSSGSALFVGTAEAFVANISAINGLSHLISVTLTDTHVLPLTSEAQLAQILGNDQLALAAIQGGFTFAVTTGPADKLHITTYDAQGTKLLIVENISRDGALFQQIIEHPQATGGALAKEVITYPSQDGLSFRQNELYGTDGKLFEVMRYYSDGHIQYDRKIAVNGSETIVQYADGGAVEMQSTKDVDGSIRTDYFGTDGHISSRSVSGTALGEYLALGDHGGTLAGLGGDDILLGGLGHDVLVGGTGGDIMIGGGGNDIYHVDSPDDLAIERASGGTDMVVTTLLSYQLSDHVEDLTFLGSAGASLTGNQLNNVIKGNVGDDMLDGGEGNDSLYGGDGNDLLNGGRDMDILTGGTGDDQYIVDHMLDKVVEKPSEGHDIVLAYASYILPDNIEDLTLAATAGSINGTGNALDNFIKGNNFANRLEGGAGNDKLYGEGGDDILVGGAGDDLLMGGAGNDMSIGGPGINKLYGGTGADRFVFNYGDTGSTGKTTSWIADFSPTQGDKIDLSGFDADPTSAGRQGLTYFDSKPEENIAHSVWFVNTGNFWQLHGDLNGDGVTDMVIRVDVPGGDRLGHSDLLL